MTLAGRCRTRPSGIQTNVRGFKAEALLLSDMKTFSLSIPIWKATGDSDYENVCRRHNIEAKWEEGELSMEVDRAEPDQGTIGVFFFLSHFSALLDWRDFSWRLVEKLSFFFLGGLLTDSDVFLKKWSAKILHRSNNSITADVNKSCTSRVAGVC